MSVALSAEELKKIRKRERRKLRREARKAGTPSGTIGVALPRPSTGRTSSVATIPVLPADEFEVQVATALGLPLHGQPENHTWMGYSTEYMRKHFPKPEAAAKKIQERLVRHGIVATHIALLPGVIGLGPVPDRHARPRDDRGSREQLKRVEDELPF